MKIPQVDLFNEFGGLCDAKLQGYVNQNAKGTVLICPGGAYFRISPRESEPVAMRFLQNGYNAYVLDYSTTDRYQDRVFPIQLIEAAAAMIYIKKQHPNIPSGILGFSAGGHVAASLCTLFDKDYLTSKLGGYNYSHRPDFGILCYPVISSTKGYYHKRSIANLLGDNKKYIKKYLKEVSLELQVSPNTPPTFIWHTVADESVDIANSLDYIAALKNNKVPFEAHFFQNGGHGMSLCDTTTWDNEPKYINKEAAAWFDLMIAWLNNIVKDFSEINNNE